MDCLECGETPFVARNDERDLIWKQLKECAATRSPRAVMIRGAMGTGKTRLMEWISQRALEVGAVTGVNWVKHSHFASGTSGLRAMLEREFRCAGLSPERTEERIRSLVEAYGTTNARRDHEVSSMRRLLKGDVGRDSGNLQSASDTFALLFGLTRYVTRQRPMIVIIDDAQWGMQALEWMQYVFRRSDDHPTPLLFLVAGRFDDDSNELEKVTFEQLTTEPGVEVVDLDPLNDAAHATLLEGLLGLAPALKDQILSHARGNPLFSLQIIEDLVTQGRLLPSQSGYTTPEPVAFPKSIDALWWQRLQHNFGNVDDFESAIHALELAAILGPDVDNQEWRELATQLGIEIPVNMLEQGGDLVLWHHGGWSFGNSLVREGLLVSAQRNNRFKSYHRAVALFLSGRAGSYESSHRRAQHLLAAGDTELAITPLLDCVEVLNNSKRLKEAAALIEETAAAMREADLPKTDRNYAKLVFERVRLVGELGETTKVLEFIGELLSLTQHGSWPIIRSGALRALSIHKQKARDVAGGLRHAEEALILARSGGDIVPVAGASLTYGWALIRAGRLEDAKRTLQESAELYTRIGHARGTGSAYSGLATVAREMGDLNEALRLVALSRETLLASGDHSGIARALSAKGSIAYAAGNLASAADYFQDSIEILDLLGVAHAHSVRVNLGLVLIELNKPERAKRVLIQALDGLRAAELDIMEYYCLLTLAIAEAQLVNTVGWDECVALAGAFDTADQEMDEDVARVLLKSAGWWGAADDSARAAQARALADPTRATEQEK